ncbi:hypothetical protein O6H91_15G036800 [Diphasiastrum complanatum]|uniref:Uncharacterized protein n=2 Tax=Diphasiastrum complanatum TaxID=34168 RepID=A0ACC2BHH9_DIPCM|nr:hypothetical protein O6H91_15G036800 [Diphasiastrum complanatum]KAJ7529179.1 hypothetical protein O6H91_15G036800 [Diphasiastrum complanatum]
MASFTSKVPLPDDVNLLIESDDEQETNGYHNEEDARSESSSSSEDFPPATYSASAHWPQSYRQSMDIYSHMASPASFHIFSSSAGRFGSSYLSSSRKRVPFVPETVDSLSEPLRGNKIEKLEPRIPKIPSKKGLISPKPSFITAGGYDAEVPRLYGCTLLQATLNGMNVLAGVGVLSTPYAIKQGGWLGLLLLFALSIVCCYTGVLLRLCLDSSPGLATYPDIGQAAFGNTGRILISIVLYFELYASCVEFLILEGDNLSSLFPGVHLYFGSYCLDSHILFVLLAAIFVLPTVYLRDLSLLSYVSGAGVIASLMVLICVFWVGAIDGVGFRRSGPLFNLTTFPVSVGLYGFCYSGHAVFPNIYASMKYRTDYNKVLKISFVLCTLLYGGIAVMGYTMFGQDTQSQITLNLPKQYTASKIALWTTVVNPFTKYALSLTPVALSLEELLPSDEQSLKNLWASIFIRTILVASTVLVALVVPFFGFVMAFIGSFSSMTVSVILPCACFLRIRGEKATVLEGIVCVAIIVGGVVCAIVGTYSATSGIIHSLHL